MSRLVIVASTLSLLALTSAQERNQYRVDSANVIVEVAVTDKKGKPVSDLTVDAFRIFENDVQQKVVTFVRPRVAKSAGANASLSNEQPAGQPNIRFISIVIDQANTQAPARKALVKAALEYVDRGAHHGDYFGVSAIGANLRIILPFTQDISAVRGALETFFDHPNEGAFTTSDKSQVDQQVKQLIDQERRVAATDPSRADAIRAQRMALLNSAWAQIAMQARALFAGLRSIAQSYAPLPGRKTIILFSEGFNHTPDARAGSALVVDAANRTNTTIYVIDPSGGHTGAEESSNAAQYSSNETAGGRGRAARRNVPNTVNEQMKEVADQARRSTSARGDRSDPFDSMRHIGIGVEFSDLTDLAENTGGFLIKGKNDLGKALDQIDLDTGDTYTLAYQPSVSGYDGKFRKISVSLAGYNHQLRYRRGYWAIPPGDTEKLTPAGAQLLAAVASGTLKPDVPMKLNSALLFSAAGGFEIPISLRVPARATTGMLILTVRDRKGVLIDAAQRFISNADQIDAETLQMYSRLVTTSLEPVQLMALIQFSNGMTGMSAMDVKSPEATSSGIRTTSVVLTDRVQLAESVETVLDALKIGKYQLILPPERVFSAADPLTFYVGIEGGGDLGVEVAIRAGETTVQKIPVEAIVPGQPGRRYLLKQFRMTSLPAGSYELQVVVEELKTKVKLTQSTAFTTR